MHESRTEEDEIAERQHTSSVSQGGNADGVVPVETLNHPEPAVSYSSLPHKVHLSLFAFTIAENGLIYRAKQRQLAILMLARLAEPLAASSIQSYIYFQLRYFNPTASAATISAQAGAIFSSKMAANSCTAILWGRLADAEYGGRKLVLAFGLLASTGALLGYGFSKSLMAALVWQVIDGALNSTVSMVRCMSAELNPQKKCRARALTLLPLFTNLGTLIGPLIGGFLASSTTQSTSKSVLSEHPYAAPNIVIATVHAVAAFAVIWSLDETSETVRKSKTSLLNSILDAVKTWMRREPKSQEELNETLPILPDIPSSTGFPSPKRTKATRIPNFRQMWTRNVISTLLAHFIISGHLGTFSNLWVVFLSIPPSLPPHASYVLPRVEPDHSRFDFRISPTSLTGGLGMDPRGVGVTMSILGAFGVLLQVMIYPVMNDRLGTIRLWRTGLFVFPVAYFVAPFCAMAPLSTQTGNALHQPLVLVTMLFILLLFVTGRTFVVPATTLLINDCTPHPSVRGTIHTTGTLVGNLSKTIFPAIALPIFGYGLRVGVVGLAFWLLAGLAVIACIVSAWVSDGSAGGEVHLND